MSHGPSPPRYDHTDAGPYHWGRLGPVLPVLFGLADDPLGACPERRKAIRTISGNSPAQDLVGRSFIAATTPLAVADDADQTFNRQAPALLCLKSI